LTGPASLFEVSWEVCHKVGGVHTVVSTKARSLVERFGDDYVAVGPWLLSEGNAEKVLDPDPRFDAFSDGCRAAGVPVRVGRWRIPGSPRAILVEFTGLYARKDQILESLWRRYQVDSLAAGWDYVEPVLFGHAAGIVVERWFREFGKGPAVAQFHEWMAGAGLLHLKSAVPEIGTVFTTHASVLGRALAAEGLAPIAGLAGRTPAAAAESLGVRGKHSLEDASAREADVLTAVSTMTADEVAAFHGRRPETLLPNGLDVDAIAAAGTDLTPGRPLATLVRVASRFTGEDATGARMVCVAGRMEIRNKGYDLLLAAAAELAKRPGPRVVLWLFVPAGHSGLRHKIAGRLKTDALAGGPAGVVTHHIFEGDADAIVKLCAENGLANAAGSRVKVVYVPAYLHGNDGAIDLPYEVVVGAMDLTVFPSFYDAWGYTPQESLALGVPTVTTDCAGFGRWAAAEGLGPDDGVHVLPRAGRTFDEAKGALASLLDAALAGPRPAELSGRCRAAARRTSWTNFVAHCHEAFAAAAAAAAARPASQRTVQRVETRGDERPARPSVYPIEVANVVPPELAGLVRLAANWRFSWDPEIAALFEELSPSAWETLRNNPVRLLREAPPKDLAARAADPAYRRRLYAAVARTDAYLKPPAAAPGPVTPEHPVAYVCAEYGLHESLPIYSGGLGVLAGDHLRAASDLGLPLVAIGLLYRKGYMRQRLQGGVEQVALVDEVDPRLQALTLVTGRDGRPVEVELNFPGTTLHLRAWRADVGRVALYLLDSDVEANRPADRALTHSLYGGDAEHRVRQEIVLGRGGVRLLEKLGIRPSVFHVNEGHGAFVVLERVGELVRDAGLTFDEAREAVAATTVFTTHTPVPAGHDVFDEGLMRRHFADAPDWLGLPWEQFMALGSSHEEPGFNMTNLALRFAGFVNGVSRRHGEVSRGLLRSACPHLAVEEVPVRSITNGVHLSAWASAEIAHLLGRGGEPVTGADFERAANADLDALWAARKKLRQRLLARVASHLRRSFEDRRDSPALLERTLSALTPDAMYVGFARRFATYKRADLVLRDPGRLRDLLTADGKPVRLFVAGKAHPRDHAAKEMLARVARVARSDEFAGRLVVLENYDMGLARTLVQGVDVWLNNPRPPLEASGTSGMKAAANGALNLSVGDGWWLEGFAGTNGWLVGDETYAGDDAVQDELDAASLHRLLEEEVVPLFFRRDLRGVPREWLERVRRSLATIPPVFDAARMVAEYRDLAYAPLAAGFQALRADGWSALRQAASARRRLAAGIAAARIVRIAAGDSAVVGQATAVRVDVDLGTLAAEDVAVEFVVGRRTGAELAGVTVVPLAPEAQEPGAVRRWSGSFTPREPGSLGYFVRVRPRGPVSLRDPAVWA
jgi:phosphorylase/glycogen(starch) synthase